MAEAAPAMVPYLSTDACLWRGRVPGVLLRCFIFALSVG
jgi:hypothetical protein